MSLKATSKVYRRALLRRCTWSKYAFSSSGSITTTVSRLTTRNMLFLRPIPDKDCTEDDSAFVELVKRAFGVDTDVALRSAFSPLAALSTDTSTGLVRTATRSLAVCADGLVTGRRACFSTPRSRDGGTRTYIESSEVDVDVRGVSTCARIEPSRAISPRRSTERCCYQQVFVVCVKLTRACVQACIAL